MARAKGTWLAMLGAWLLVGSCYNPNFGQVLYKCGPDKVCPDGLSCLDGKHCTYPSTACIQGGIMIATNTYVCPGAYNGCTAGYSQCPSSVTSTLCTLDILDGGKPEPCAICCEDYGDMAVKP